VAIEEQLQQETAELQLERVELQQLHSQRTQSLHEQHAHELAHVKEEALVQMSNEYARRCFLEEELQVCVALCCCVMRCVAMCCSVLQCVAGCCRVLQ